MKKRKDFVQEKIMEYVDKIPGIRYRELLRMTGVSNGVLSYHLHFLDITGKVRVTRVNNKVTRYFSHDISKEELNLIGLFRQPTTRKIIIYILESRTCRFNDIVMHTKKVPSTISWHLSKLSDANIIKRCKQQNEFKYYEIGINKLKLQELLSKYKSSFTEKIVDDYLDTINEF